jgi:hypothetical protein
MNPSQGYLSNEEPSAHFSLHYRSGWSPRNVEGLIASVSGAQLGAKCC